MSSPELEKNPAAEEEESTIFGASPIKTEAPKKPSGNRMLKKVIAAVLVLVLLCGATAAVITLIPEPEGEETVSGENIKVMSVDPEKIAKVKITRRNSVSTYVSSVTETTNEETGEKEKKVSWTIEGVDPALTETTAISMVIDSALSLSATRTVVREEGADYGFASPQYKVELIGHDAADNKTLTIGKETPSRSGVYATLGEDIYLISADAADDFAKTDEEMATSFAISAAVVDGDHMDYFSDEKLSAFDKITLSGTNFPRKLVFEMNSTEDSGNYNDYIMTAPVRRYADSENVSSLLEIAASGLTAAEAYKYNPSSADLKAYGLDAPELVLAIEYGTKKVEFKASRVDSEYFAVLVGGRENIIFKVANSFLPFAELKDISFANKLTFIEVLTDFESMTFKTPTDTYDFGISYTPETDDEEELLEITLDGKKIDAENFQRFYQHIVVECNEVTLDKMSGTPALTIIGKKAGETATVKFIKASDRRYYVEVDSAPIGFISTTNMEKIINYLSMAAKGEKVPELA